MPSDLAAASSSPASAGATAAPRLATAAAAAPAPLMKARRVSAVDVGSRAGLPDLADQSDCRISSLLSDCRFIVFGPFHGRSAGEERASGASTDAPRLRA